MSKLMMLLVVLVCVTITLATPGHYVHNYYKNQVPQEVSYLNHKDALCTTYDVVRYSDSEVCLVIAQINWYTAKNFNPTQEGKGGEYDDDLINASN